MSGLATALDDSSSRGSSGGGSYKSRVDAHRYTHSGPPLPSSQLHGTLQGTSAVSHSAESPACGIARAAPRHGGTRQIADESQKHGKPAKSWPWSAQVTGG
ncbi:unnamed protein product [Lampetra fluviatilis]